MSGNCFYDADACVSPALARPLEAGGMMLGAPERANHQEVPPPSSPFLHLSEDEEVEGHVRPQSNNGGDRAADATAPALTCTFPTPPLEGPEFSSAPPSETETDVRGTLFIHGSSLEDTPESSPGCSPMEGGDHASEGIEDESPAAKDEFESRSEKGPRKRSRSSSDGDSSEDDEDLPLPKNLKLPQRKGGMQLWQFLYTLLTDPKKRYSELIQWTDKEKQREFRLQEPEAIAIWWGEHKNKKNMSYDKLSRSLRYYYDKGIIRKIPGERYVYQFCVDPEMMYKHIGISESRPKLKPMPANAKFAMSKYANEQSTLDVALSCMEGPYRMMARMPATLHSLQDHGPQKPQGHFAPPLPPPPPLVMSSLPLLPPPPPPPPYDSSLALNFGFGSIPGSIMDDIKPLLAQKRHSAPSFLMEPVEHPMFHQFSVPCHQFMSPPVDSFSAPLQPHELCPPALSSSQPNPQSSYMYSSDCDTLELANLIELTYSDTSCPSPPVSGGNSTFCHGICQGEMIQWDFC